MSRTMKLSLGPRSRMGLACLALALGACSEESADGRSGRAAPGDGAGAGAGAGAGGAGGAGGTVPGAPGAEGAPAPAAITLAPCVPSGKGKDYQVGPGAGQLASLDLVPWESLAAGDTVRIAWRAAPYAGKFAIAAKGTQDAPVRVCGIRGPNGERPVIDGQGATTRAQLLGVYGNKAYDQDIFQARSIIVVKHDPAAGFSAFPEWIQIDGLALRRAHPDYTFKDAAGQTKPYDAFGACLWVERGHHVTLADDDIRDCSQGIFSKSTDDGPFAVTQDLRIAGNHIEGCGIAGDEHMHGSYVQSVGVVYELNTYGTMRAGADGNAIKDRSVGTVVRYNRILDGAHAIDLVEAEDFPQTATADPAYRATFVYGNQITKDGGKGTFVHYGGDHFGSAAGASWGEPIFRQGTLYFFHNTVVATGSSAQIFQLSTTKERAEVWNNVFVFAASVKERCLRANQEVAAAWTPAGIVSLGRNWATEGVQDSDQYHPLPGQLLGMANLVKGASAPIDLATWAPTSGSPVVDQAVGGPTAAAGYQPTLQLDPQGLSAPRTTKGAALDLGAVESP